MQSTVCRRGHLRSSVSKKSKNVEQIAYPKFKFKPEDMQKVEQVVEVLPHIVFPCKSYVLRHMSKHVRRITVMDTSY